MRVTAPVVFAAVLGLLPLAARLPGQLIFFLLAAVFALASGGWRSDQSTDGLAARLSNPLVPYGLLMLVMVLSSLRTQYAPLAALELVVWGTGLLILFSLPRLSQLTWRGEPMLPERVLLAWASVGAVAVAVYGLADFAVGIRAVAPGEIYRTRSFLIDPQLASAYLALFLPVATAFYLEASKPRERYLWATAAVLMAAGLTATYTRGGWLGSIAGIALLGALVDRKLWLKAAAVIALLALIFPGVMPRLLNTGHLETDYASRYRLTLWRVALMTFEESPATGAGLGNYPLELDRRTQEGSGLERVPDSQYPHNSLLFIMAEMGVVGAIPFLWLALVLFLNQARAYLRLRGQPGRVLAAGGLAALISFGLHTNFQSMLHSPVAAPPFWLVAAAFIAAQQRSLAAATTVEGAGRQ